MVHRRLVWMLLLGGTFGCGSACEVSGTVTYDGQPVDNGMVTFQPADGLGPTCAGEVQKGKFTVKGLTPGSKLVQVTAVKPVPFARSSEEMASRAAEARAKGNSTGIIDPADAIPADAEGNNATVEVKPGTQTIKLELKPSKKQT